jgi:hypothetical protein
VAQPIRCAFIAGIVDGQLRQASTGGNAQKVDRHQHDYALDQTSLRLPQLGPILDALCAFILSQLTAIIKMFIFKKGRIHVSTQVPFTFI